MVSSDFGIRLGANTIGSLNSMIYWATQNIHTRVVTVRRETYTWVNAVPGDGGQELRNCGWQIFPHLAFTSWPLEFRQSHLSHRAQKSNKPRQFSISQELAPLLIESFSLTYVGYGCEFRTNTMTGKKQSCKLTVADSHNKLTQNTDASFSGN